MATDESLFRALDSIANRRVVLFGGKGGVGKTTIARRAAAHWEKTRKVVSLSVESLDANALYSEFLAQNLDQFLEIGDRGTYLDREELRRFFELSLPGVDELMTWMRIGELAEENPDAMIVVDTAPTGHTLRMLSSGDHFRQLANALDAMQEKHRSMVFQFTRREVRDAADAFIEEFSAKAARRRALLDTFVPVFLSEPWVVEQTARLIAEVGVDVPFAVLNRAIGSTGDCELDVLRKQRDDDVDLGVPVVEVERWCGGARPRAPSAAALSASAQKLTEVVFLAGKGGTGKTTCSASIALQQTGKTVVISVDPAHSLRDVFAHEQPPGNVTVEIIDTKAKWRRFRDTLGVEIEKAIDSLTPRGVSVAHDGEAMKQLIEIAPPGADELFAIQRLAELVADDSIERVIVDTAPTGHFLRLLDLPKTAGEWVRELMRILLRYRELVSSATLGEELVAFSRALKELDAALHSERTSVIVVTRAESAVVEETKRLIEEVERRGLRIGGVIANSLTPANECKCDQANRANELAILGELSRDVVAIERRDAPVTSLAELASLVPIN
jgi:arsenite/tail-anchored protein-transporting ATPase